MTRFARYGKTRVKICCIRSVDEAVLAMRYGASALGLVADMPSGPGVIPEELISEIASTFPPYVTSVLLTSRKSVDEIVKQHQRCGTNAVQMVDRLELGSACMHGKEIPIASEKCQYCGTKQL